MSVDVTVVDHPLVRTAVTTLRDRHTTTPEFRRALRMVSILLAFEATRGLGTEAIAVETPLEKTTGFRLARPTVVVPILRAGLGMAEAMLTVLPDATVGHAGMFRDETTFRPQAYYLKVPPHLPQSDILVVDPMLATGSSASDTLAELKKLGAQNLVYACIIACPEGIAHLRSSHPDVPIVVAAMDRGLNERKYILPGLGDAGDRYFGT
jgi:uracil phosphoribosyltransferase